MDKKYLYAPLFKTVDNKFKTNDALVKKMAEEMEIGAHFRDTNVFEVFFKNCSVVRPNGVPNNGEGLYAKCQEVSQIRKFIDYHKSENK